MTTPMAIRRRYVGDAVSTVSPSKLVLMLYDGLVRDLVVAEQAIGGMTLEVASRKLVNAQDIITELHSGLNEAAWTGGPALAQLYLWLHGELIAANVSKDAERVAACRRMCESLRDAWHQAAAQLGGQN